MNLWARSRQTSTAISPRISVVSLYDGVWVGTGSKVPNVDGLTSTTSEQEQNVRSKVGSNKKAVFNPKRGLSCARSTKVLIVHNRKVGGSNPPPATMNATAEMQWRSPVL